MRRAFPYLVQKELPKAHMHRICAVNAGGVGERRACPRVQSLAVLGLRREIGFLAHALL